MRRLTIFLCFLYFLTAVVWSDDSTAINEYRYISATDGLRLRNRPSLSGGKICVIPYNEKVYLIKETGEKETIDGITGRWSLVSWKSYQGWVFGGYLTEVKDFIEFTKSFGGNDWDRAKEVNQTADGGYILVGSTYSFGAGKNDIYLIKTNASGNREWSKTFGGSKWDSGSSVRQTDDGGYILVGNHITFHPNTRELLLIKTDSKGDRLWTKVFENRYGWGICRTLDNGYLIIATTEFAYGGEENSKAYIIKTDAKGKTVWSRELTADDSDHRVFCITRTSDNCYLIVGETGALFHEKHFDVYFVKTNTLM